MQAERPGLFDDWVTFYVGEPFGPAATNLMLARVAAASSGQSEESYLPGTTDD